MLRIDALREWLIETHGVTEPITLNRQPRKPDPCVTLTQVPGPSGEMQEVIERASCQVRVRGFPNDMASAMDLAVKLDIIMMDESNTPFWLGEGDAARYVIVMGRHTGGPQYIHYDQEQRSTYLCNYFLKIQR